MLGGIPPPPGALGGFNRPLAPAYKPPYTKKPVVPNIKMRPLHWSKVEDKAIDNTLWKELSDQEVPIDVIAIEAAFGANIPKNPALEAAAAEAAAKKAAPKVVQLIDGQRNQNISIALARFKPLTHEAIRDASTWG